MFFYLKLQKKKFLFSICARLIIFVLSFSLILSPSVGYAQSAFNLPAPGAMISLSPVFTPPLIKVKMEYRRSKVA